MLSGSIQCVAGDVERSTDITVLMIDGKTRCLGARTRAIFSDRGSFLEKVLS